MLEKRFVIVNKVIYKKQDAKHSIPRIVLTEKMLKEILIEYHTKPCGGHLGQEKTYLRINNKFWHPKLFEKVKKFCENCVKCSNIKVPKRKTIIHDTIEIPEGPMDRIEVDIQGPYKKSLKGNQYIIVATDYFSRFVFAKALKISRYY